MSSWSPAPTLSLAPTFDRHRRWSLAAGPPPPPKPPPELPQVVLRRIIRHALALPASFPDGIAPLPPAAAGVGKGDAAAATQNWEVLAGRAAQRRLSQRAATREAAARTARTLALVCRAWKRYLYTEPNIHTDNVAALAHALQRGDRKWSDINLRPHSVPGRWITVLDLSNLGPGARYGSYYGVDGGTVARACGVLLDLAPSVTHLRLPASGVRLGEIRLAACARRLHSLEGVPIASAEDEEEVVRLLRVTRQLRVLSLVWVIPEQARAAEDGEEAERVDSETSAPVHRSVNLPHLHTLSLTGGAPGELLATLTRSCLPALTRLVITTYDSRLLTFEDDARQGGRRALQVAHGAKVLSLTYISAPGWGSAGHDLPPPPDTLELHPQLRHLHLALPHTLLSEHAALAPSFARRDHPLSLIVLPRWPRAPGGARNASPSPPPANAAPPLTPMEETPEWLPLGTPPVPPPTPAATTPAPNGNPFVAALFSRPSRIRAIAIDGFTWVSPELGRAAAESGDSGMMRGWAAWLARISVELRDMDGAGVPAFGRVRKDSGGGFGGFSGGFSGFGGGGFSGFGGSGFAPPQAGFSAGRRFSAGAAGGSGFTAVSIQRRSSGQRRRSADGGASPDVAAAAAAAARRTGAPPWRPRVFSEDSDGG